MKTAVSRAANAADKGGANAHAQAARRQSERDREDRKLAFLMLTHDRLGDVSTLDIVREQWKSSGSEDVLRILFNQLESMQRKDDADRAAAQQRVNAARRWRDYTEAEADAANGRPNLRAASGASPVVINHDDLKALRLTFPEEEVWAVYYKQIRTT